MKKINQLMEKEIRGCFEYFWNHTNTDLGSKGYGMVLDSTRKDDMASFAAVGFALPAYMIGVERGFITREQGEDRILNTLKTIENNVGQVNGFYRHFVNVETAERYEMSEYSTIDTAIMLVGAITVAEYFQGEIKETVDRLLERTDWEWLVAERYGKPCFRMAYNPDLTGRWGSGPDGFAKDGWWDHYAEQLMMYILYAGKEDVKPQLAIELYEAFQRTLGSYKGENYVYCLGNALFIHQFTHLFFDFSKYLDFKGFDWFRNSKTATLANKATCEELGMPENSWGLTAMHCQDDYYVTGGYPRGTAKIELEPIVRGVVAPYGPLCSMPFTPEESKKALTFIDETLPEMWGECGLYDSYDLSGDEPWVSETYIGIDKGPTIIMLDNYLGGTTWKYFMQSEYVQRAIKVLKFQEK
ncbi:MAG: glucoamylase family protein [Cellulosilyticaceae bacterium]